MFGPFVPLLDILQILRSGQSQANSPFTTCYLNLFVKHCNDCASKCEELDGIPCVMHCYLVLTIVFIFTEFLSWTCISFLAGTSFFSCTISVSSQNLSCTILKLNSISSINCSLPPTCETMAEIVFKYAPDVTEVCCSVYPTSPLCASTTSPRSDQ